MATYLQIVQKAIRKSGAKIDVPTDITTATGLEELFVEWVQDSWKDIQLEHLGWKWRVDRDYTVAVLTGVSEYAIPAVLEDFDKRTVTIYDAIADETPVEFVNYHYWRVHLNKMSPSSPAKPQKYTIAPDDKIVLYPAPDKNYTLRMDGHVRVEILDDQDNTAVPTGLLPEYHDGIMWRAVMYYAAHFEDGAKLQEAQERFRPYKKYYEERELEDVTLDTTALYSRSSPGACW